MDGIKLKQFGCFGLTELGHGSNVRGIETIATYCPETKEFDLHSPTQTSIKFWIGNLGKSAHMMVVWAQLYTQGKCQGVHAFVIPVRDEIDHNQLPGCEIGDCGLKIGIDGVDNGSIRFSHYKVPKTALLNKLGDVTDDGTYVSPIKSEGKRFGMHIASLTGGRVTISRITNESAQATIKIALRFACARKQTLAPEKAIIDYPMHQERLFVAYAETFTYFLAAN